MQAVKTGTEESIRSGCPVSLGLDVFGDRWTLLIVRDLMFGGKRHFREMLGSEEHISSNILADRLKMLLAQGIIHAGADPEHAQKVIYRLTEKGVALYPVLMAISDWSYEYRPVEERYLPRNQAGSQAEDQSGRRPDADQQMADLRRAHLG